MKWCNHLLVVFLTSLFIISCSRLTAVKESVKEKVVGDRDSQGRLAFKIVWSKNLDPEYETGNMPISFNAPLIHEGLLFIGAPTGKFTAYQLKDGREIWKVDGGRALVGRPAIYNDQVIYGNVEGRVFARDALTGQLKYAVEVGDSLEAQPVLYKDKAFFHLRDHRVVCIDAQTGKILWTYKRNITFSPTIHGTSRPYADGQKLYVGFADGFLVALSVDEGVVLWEQKLGTASKFVDVDVTPVVLDQLIYASSFTGNLFTLRPENGSVVNKVSLTPSRAPLQVQGQDILYLATVSGSIYKLNKTNNEILLERSLVSSGGGLTSIGYWTEKNLLVVVSTRGIVYFLDPQNLQTKDEFFLGSKISTVFGEIAIDGDTLAINSSRNKLYVFR